MTIRRALPVILGIACVSAAVAAQEHPSAAIVSWKADKVEHPAEGVLEATGHVQLSMGSGLQLRADSVAVRKSPIPGEPLVQITAVGNVELARGDERFRFHRLVFDPSTRRATFEMSADLQ